MAEENKEHVVKLKLEGKDEFIADIHEIRDALKQLKAELAEVADLQEKVDGQA